MASHNKYESNSGKFGPFLWGVLAGGLIGAAFGLLYAPKAGAETRRDLGDRLDDITDTINDILKGNSDETEGMPNAGRSRGAWVVDQARERASDLMSEAERAIHEARRRAAPPQQTNTAPDVPPDANTDEL